MRIHRFYLNTSISQDIFDIADKDLVHQWKSVFRYNVGSQVIVFDGFGVDYLCIITSLRNLGATLQVVSKIKTADPTQRKNIWLCVALIKKDNFELVVQKATELGVNNIVPIICEHSEKRKLNMERMQKIAVESSEQSGRGDIPQIHQVIELYDILQQNILPNDKLVLHPIVESGNFQFPISNFQKKDGPNDIAIFIGPEGGFSDKEIAVFKSYNMPVVSLGTQILRAETAAIATASLFLLQ